MDSQIPINHSSIEHRPWGRSQDNRWSQRASHRFASSSPRPHRRTQRPHRRRCRRGPPPGRTVREQAPRRPRSRGGTGRDQPWRRRSRGEGRARDGRRGDRSDLAGVAGEEGRAAERWAGRPRRGAAGIGAPRGGRKPLILSLLLRRRWKRAKGDGRGAKDGEELIRNALVDIIVTEDPNQPILVILIIQLCDLHRPSDTSSRSHRLSKLISPGHFGCEVETWNWRIPILSMNWRESSQCPFFLISWIGNWTRGKKHVNKDFF